MEGRCESKCWVRRLEHPSFTFVSIPDHPDRNGGVLFLFLSLFYLYVYSRQLRYSYTIIENTL